MTILGTLTHGLKAALEAIDQQAPVDFFMAETLADAGLVIFNQDNDYWYELSATGEMQLGKYAAWDELRAERDAAYKLLRELQRNLQGLNALTPAHVTAFKAATACGLIDAFLDAVDRRNSKAAETSSEEAE